MFQNILVKVQKAGTVRRSLKFVRIQVILSYTEKEREREVVDEVSVDEVWFSTLLELLNFIRRFYH